MAFEIVITGDRSEARRHIGGPLCHGGLRVSIPTPSWWNDRMDGILDMEQASAYSGGSRKSTLRNGRRREDETGTIRLLPQWLCSRKRTEVDREAGTGRVPKMPLAELFTMMESDPSIAYHIPSCTRSSPVYTTNRLPRRKPTSVKLNSQASWTARLEGAETQATIGTPATKAF